MNSETKRSGEEEKLKLFLLFHIHMTIGQPWHTWHIEVVIITYFSFEQNPEIEFLADECVHGCRMFSTWKGQLDDTQTHTHASHIWIFNKETIHPYMECLNPGTQNAISKCWLNTQYICLCIFASKVCSSLYPSHTKQQWHTMRIIYISMSFYLTDSRSP